MKRRIHIELLVTSGLAILLTLTFAMFVFYGLFRSQIIRDLETDARVMKNMGVFDDISRMAEKNGSISSEDLRITVVSPGGDVLFDSSADAAVMENHEDRPEIRTALEAGEGSGSRRSETMDKNLFYYAVRMENGNVLRISREADSFFAVFQNMLPTVLEVSLVLFVLSIFLSNYFTKTLVGPIEEMARNISDPGQEVVYRELEPFVATIRQQHDDIIKSAQMRQEFTANVSHELKTPLTVILSNAELLEAAPLEDRPARWADNIRSEAGQMKSLVEEMLTLARADNGVRPVAMEPVSLSDVATDCALAFEPVAFEAGKPLEERITADVTVVGDADRLRRLVLRFHRRQRLSGRGRRRQLQHFHRVQDHLERIHPVHDGRRGKGRR